MRLCLAEYARQSILRIKIGRALGTVLGAIAQERCQMVEKIEGLLSRHKKIRFLYHLGEDFKGFELAAVWDDTKLGLKHFTGWEKMAVVSDVEWVRAAIKIFGLGIPGEVRVFHNGELAEAIRWISA